MPPIDSGEKKIPIRKSSKSPDKMGSPEPKWRIVDLAEKTRAERSPNAAASAPRTPVKAKLASSGYKRKRGFPIKAVVMGIINLAVIFGLGIGAYFGWAYYKDNYANKDSDNGKNGNVASDDYDDRDLQERVDEIKEIIGNSSTTPDNASSTSTGSSDQDSQKSMLKIKAGVDYLNIRKDSTTNSEIIGKAMPGEEYEYAGVNDGWYHIVRAEGNGWVHGNYIEVISESNSDPEIETPSQTETSETGEVSTKVKIVSSVGYANVRDKVWGNIIGKVNAGEEYEFTKTESGWYFIDVKIGDTVGGWVHGDYADEI